MGSGGRGGKRLAWGWEAVDGLAEGKGEGAKDTSKKTRPQEEHVRGTG